MKISRNAPCPCGSGRKYKKCCLPKAQSLDFQVAKEKKALEKVNKELLYFKGIGGDQEFLHVLPAKTSKECSYNEESILFYKEGDTQGCRF